MRTGTLTDLHMLHSVPLWKDGCLYKPVNDEADETPTGWLYLHTCLLPRTEWAICHQGWVLGYTTTEPEDADAIPVVKENRNLCPIQEWLCWFVRTGRVRFQNLKLKWAKGIGQYLIAIPYAPNLHPPAPKNTVAEGWLYNTPVYLISKANPEDAKHYTLLPMVPDDDSTEPLLYIR